jgi:hypothetical protein
MFNSLIQNESTLPYLFLKVHCRNMIKKINPRLLVERCRMVDKLRLQPVKSDELSS